MASIKTVWQWLQGAPPAAPTQAGGDDLPRQEQAQDGFPAPAREIEARVRARRQREQRLARDRSGPWQQK